MARTRNGVDQFFRDKDSHGSSSISADQNPVARSYGRTKTPDRARADRSRPPQDRHRASFPRALRSFRHAHAPSISSFDPGDHGPSDSDLLRWTRFRDASELCWKERKSVSTSAG